MIFFGNHSVGFLELMRFFLGFFKKVHFNWGPNADFRHFKHSFQVTLCVDKILGKLLEI